MAQPATGSDQSGFQALIEFGDQAENALGKVTNGADWINGGLRYYTGIQAFRKYSWLSGAAKNVSGNFRGMVVNKDMKAFFDITSKNAEYLKYAGDALVLGAIALEIMKNADQIKQIWSSNDDALTKGQKFSVMTSMIITRTLTAPLVPGVHLVARALEKTCSITRNSSACVQTIEVTDAKVKSTYEQITNDDNVLHYINTNLVFVP